MSLLRPTHALVRKPSPAYGAYYAAKGIAVSDSLTHAQHAAYIAALRQAGLDVAILPPHMQHHDCVFIEDTTIVWNGHALITRMNDVREGEQRDVEAWLEGKFQIAHVPADARIEGGDVLHLDDLTLVGRSARTNDAGIEALRAFMSPLGHIVRAVPVTRCLHLKSAMTYLGERTILISPELIDLEPLDGYAFINVDPAEPHGGNVLRLNDRLAASSAFPKTADCLLAFANEHAMKMILLNISETHKGDGALTCQSILW